jgi:hypothetical protein
MKIVLICCLFPVVVWAAPQQDILGTWHVDKVVCSSDNTDLGSYDKVYFTFTVAGKFSSLNSGLSNEGKKDPNCSSGEDTDFAVVYTLDKTILKLKSSLHKDTCGSKEYANPARIWTIVSDSKGEIRQTMAGWTCDHGKGMRTRILRKVTL